MPVVQAQPPGVAVVAPWQPIDLLLSQRNRAGHISNGRVPSQMVMNDTPILKIVHFPDVPREVGDALAYDDSVISTAGAIAIRAGFVMGNNTGSAAGFARIADIHIFYWVFSCTLGVNLPGVLTGETLSL